MSDLPKAAMAAGITQEDIDHIEIYRDEADRRTLVERWRTNAKIVGNGTRVINKKRIKVNIELI